MFRTIVLKIVRFVFAFYCPLTIVGKEHIGDEPLIVIGNHYSWLDAIIIAVAYPKPFVILGKKELFKYRLPNWFFRKMGALPVDRHGNDFGVLRKAIAILREDSLILFPEGTRNKTLRPLEPRLGVGIMAYRSARKVLPVTILGVPGFRKRIQVIFHESVDYKAQFTDKPKNEDHLRALSALMDQIYEPVIASEA